MRCGGQVGGGLCGTGRCRGEEIADVLFVGEDNGEANVGEANARRADIVEGWGEWVGAGCWWRMRIGS